MHDLLLLFAFLFSLGISLASEEVANVQLSITSPQYDLLHVVRPGDFFQVEFLIPGIALEESFEVIHNPSGWSNEVLALMGLRNKTSTNLDSVFSFPNPVTASMLEGFHTLVWQNAVSNRTLTAKFEVSCTDGNLCNGMEHVVRQRSGLLACSSPLAGLCEDRSACTLDTCSSEGKCSHDLARPSCSKCLRVPGTGGGNTCRPGCLSKRCGPDNCGGVCGPNKGFCPAGKGLSCKNGQCVKIPLPGTCEKPIELELGSLLTTGGTLVLKGNSRKGSTQLAPRCWVNSKATEVYYLIKPPADFLGLEVRIIPQGWDSIGQILEAPVNLTNICKEGQVVSCNDDETPPGEAGSRLTWMLRPNHQYLVQVDGFGAKDAGVFQLELRFTPQCTMNCDNTVCGASNCGPEFACGSCLPPLVCSPSTFTCVANPCVPNCPGKAPCGPDGCGGTCGTCDTPAHEVCYQGQCKVVDTCDHDLPTCGFQGCAVNQFCGTDCVCRDLDAALPDLVIAPGSFEVEIVDKYVVLPSSCTFREGCVEAPGARRVLKFITQVMNQGNADLSFPSPPDLHPELYTWFECHGHYHFQSFVHYTLLDADKVQVAVGRKDSFCAEDTVQVWPEHPSMPCTKQHTCGTQGISIGWKDIYDKQLDCQFIDITHVPRGTYTLTQCVNYKRMFQEKTFENNCASEQVYLP